MVELMGKRLNPFVLSFERLKSIAEKIIEHLPHCERISMYARITNIKTKTTEELKVLRSLGINHLYIGIETGHDETLTRIHKGTQTMQAVRGSRNCLSRNYCKWTGRL
ncbi:radical SAM -containing domain protein [Desulfosporosinus sp. OT]|uniref:radical SAM -containing domain protein n=1 Tax=Desulfosporosinus sp. OT TaxID=913865 RepID=UPI0002239E12|nr:radical SAM -containing domain protein [Desulfosporosinus sp. OT]EGW40121.1 radical SAM -containing domain protein [Desulfosporosinus sp. OT]